MASTPTSANEYIASKLGGYDWRGKTAQVGDLNREWQAQQNEAANMATEPSIKWASDTGGLTYNPGGGTAWSPLTEDALSNPDVLSMFNMGLTSPGAAQGAYTKFNQGLSPETQSAITGLSGSSHTLDPEVLSKMWK